VNNIVQSDTSFLLFKRNSGILTEPFTVPGHGHDLIGSPIWQSRQSGKGGPDQSSKPPSEIKIVENVTRGARSRNKPEKSEEWPGGNETLLVVEDETALRDLLVELLRSEGYVVMSAADGDEALAILRACKDQINLVITDMGSHQRNGLEMLGWMRLIDSDVKAILTSVYVAPRQESEILRSGVRAIISKPYHVVELLKAVRNVLDKLTDETAASSENDVRFG
jgi:CheY-like chemotaxis protein